MKGASHGDILRSVLPLYPLEHLLPSSRVEVEVNVGGLAGNEEAGKGQISREDIHIGKQETVGDAGVRRRASARDANALRPRPPCHLPRHEDIVGVSQLADNGEFML